jgi:protein-tyrosine phosphatase
MTAPRLLFVCLGNICRSSAAEGVMRVRAAARGIDVTLSSAGTGGWHAGSPPDPRMQAAATARGYDIADLRARQTERADFTRFDMILAMDRSNLADLRRMAPKGGVAPVLMLPDGGDVPDPYYGGEDGFAHVLTLLEDAAEHLLTRIARH